MSEKLKHRSEIPDEFKWAVEKMYKNIDSFEAEFDFVKQNAVKLKSFEGNLSNVNSLREYLGLYEKLARKVEKLYVYAAMRADEDTSNNEFQALCSRIESFEAEFSSYVSFFEPEILAQDEKTLISLILNDNELKSYEFFFRDIFKSKQHILSKEVEEVLSGVSDSLRGASNIYEILTNAEIEFDTIKDSNGKEIELTEGSYGVLIRSKDRVLRENAFKALFTAYKKYENTLATTLTTSLKSFIFIAKTRKYKNALEASLKPNDIPLEVYYNSVDTINKNLKSLHRYVDLKKKLLGLEKMHMYDLYVPVVDIKKEKIEFKDAVEIVKEGLNPLGSEYISIFDDGVKSGWIDIYENKGKRTGAYSSGMHDTMPYVLLNYNYDLNDVSTFAHEMGHSIHSHYSRSTQPYIYSSYTLFSAEIASTTNEILLINNLIEKETDKNRKLFLVNHELEQIRTTVFRQLMFAQFELIIHEKTENGDGLTANEYNKIWLDLNKKFFGDNIIVDDEIESEWARIPHFYSDFYVYQYATGYAAASAFAKSILEKEENAVEKYKGFLKAGGSKYPIDAIKDAGVDMETSKPLEDTISRFNELLDILETLI